MENKALDLYNKIENYVIKEDYKGYDPYDGLMSPLFKLPIFRTNKIIRLVFQQVFRRLMFNFRPVFQIQKGLNPVTLGLSIQTYSCRLCTKGISSEKKSFYINEISRLIGVLINISTKGYSGICWGYNFDWEARYAKVPAFHPTVVATGIVTNGLYECLISMDKIFDNKGGIEIQDLDVLMNKVMNQIKELLISAGEFVMHDLKKSYEEDTFCYSYSPTDTQRVYNATLMGARLISQIYSINKDDKYLTEARKTVEYVCNNQNNDFSWSYSKGDTRSWVDNIHTGYILECLDSYIKISGDDKYQKCLNDGLNYYINNFFKDGYIPKYYNTTLYPIDATALGQSVMTLLKFGYNDIAKNIVNIYLPDFIHLSGYSYYRAFRIYKNKISYMRWSTVWIMLALSKYLSK